MMLALMVISGISAETNCLAGPFYDRDFCCNAPRLVPSSLYLLICSFRTCFSLKQCAGRGLSLIDLFVEVPVTDSFL